MGISGFELSHADAEAPVQRILSASLKQHTSLLRPEINGAPCFWDATFLGLDQVQLFQTATPEEQLQMVTIANQDLLEEIYWVEQAGMGYMAKMLLLAETCEERMLYSLFAAEEAAHFAQIRLFLAQEPVFRGDTFLQWLADVVETPDRALLLAVVQVVLEGWGLSHYRSLAKACLDPGLAEVLRGFLQAESRHHAAGVVQFQRFEYASTSLQSIQSVLTEFLQMVQVGPQRLVGAIARVKGPLSQLNQIQILHELQTEIHSNTRLQLLRSLMQGAIPDSVIQALEEQGSFQSYPAHRCLV